MSKTKTELHTVMRQIEAKIRAWQKDVERSKGFEFKYVNAASKTKTMAAMLQYNVALRVSRLGANLLVESIDNRRNGVLFGLTKRPMFESYTRGAWLDLVADAECVEKIMTRRRLDSENNWTTLKGKGSFPLLRDMWSALEEAGMLKEMVVWMRTRGQWWNDNTHIGPRAMLMGWSNEGGVIHYTDKQIEDDIHTLVEIGAQCAARFHILNRSGSGTEKEDQIYRERDELRKYASDFLTVQ